MNSADLLNTAAYVEAKQLGLGNALGSGVFSGGSSEMKKRIKITGFVIDNTVQPPAVTT